MLNCTNQGHAMSKHDDYRLGTKAVHAGHTPDESSLSRAVPIYATSSFMFRDTEHAADLFALKEAGNIYSRLMNPTCDVLERRLAALDGGVGALTFASGMAAISAAVMTLAGAGENFISSRSLYGGTWTLFSQTLSKLGIEVRFFDVDRPEQIAELADDKTRFVYIESMGNPKNDVPDFRVVADAAHAAGVPLIVDNTVLTPAVLRPIEHGADMVVYSTTKYLGGHGVHVGGAIVDSGNFEWAADADRWPQFAKPDASYHGAVFTDVVGNKAFIVHIRTHILRDMGGCMSPFAAWTFLLGLETLHLRLPRHMENARILAGWLAEHPSVESVNHPSLPDHPFHAMARKYLHDAWGAIIGFDIKGGKDNCIKFINSVKLISHLANIGDAKTLVIHPASTTHQQLSDEDQLAAGVRPQYIRLSVGIEDIADLKADLDQALWEAYC